MNHKFKLWIPLPAVIRDGYIEGLSTDGAYRDIRRGTFPFRTEVIAGRIYVSARDLGLFDLPVEPQPETQPEPQVASATA
jgi:hypothetical protein